jgi:uncharacterized protein (TIGR03437 family)
MNCSSLALRLLPALLLVGASAGLFAQSAGITTVSAADGSSIVAPDSIASSWGTNLTAQTVGAVDLPLPTTLGGLQLTITDSADAQANAGLYMVSPNQINLMIAPAASVGMGSVLVTSGTKEFIGDVLISNVAPTLFTANMMGTGTAAGQSLNVSNAGVATLNNALNSVTLSAANSNTYLVLYGTGIRRHSLNPVQALIDGVKVPVLYADEQGQFAGLDQVNIGPLPASLAGAGAVDIELFVDGVPANVVTATFR